MTGLKFNTKARKQARFTLKHNGTQLGRSNNRWLDWDKWLECIRRNLWFQCNKLWCSNLMCNLQLCTSSPWWFPPGKFNPHNLNTTHHYRSSNNLTCKPTTRCSLPKLSLQCSDSNHSNNIPLSSLFMANLKGNHIPPKVMANPNNNIPSNMVTANNSRNMEHHPSMDSLNMVHLPSMVTPHVEFYLSIYFPAL